SKQSCGDTSHGKLPKGVMMNPSSTNTGVESSCFSADVIQDYALWEVIENGDSWVSVSQTSEENRITVTKMSTPVTAEEKTNKKNDVKARGLLLMALPNEHQLTFSQYSDAKSMFAAIETRFGESLDSIFNRLQKIVSRLAILGVIIAQEDLNLKFLSSLPPEWNTHVVVWMNKSEVETMSIDDLYNNFKIVEQKVKKTAGVLFVILNAIEPKGDTTVCTCDVNAARVIRRRRILSIVRVKKVYTVRIIRENVSTVSFVREKISDASFKGKLTEGILVLN
ncbi:hypothetical protein Tco_1396533, partial [Tanacetum coccineum]